MRNRGLGSLVGGFMLLVLPYVALAEHFNIDLEVSGANGAKATAFSDQSPPEQGYNSRPVLKAHAGEPITAQFIMTNVYPHGTVKGAAIHYYVVRQFEAGQKNSPGPERGAITEGTFNLDLKPKCRIGARFSLVIDKPGTYLLRVETLRTQNTHEHFSAIDLQIE